MRVLPGRLSVSRTFGDSAAKMRRHGGIPGVVSSEPDVKIVPLGLDVDYILMGSDGIFDYLRNEDINMMVYERAHSLTQDAVQRNLRPGSFDHVSKVCGAAVNAVIKAAMKNDSTDNLSVIMLAFGNFKRLLNRATNIIPVKAPSVDHIFRTEIMKQPS
jgi:protein phosphatase PTC2/3